MQKEARFTAAVFARSLATVLVMALSACAGGGSGAVPHAGSGGTAKVKQTVTFRFDVSGQSAANRRRPQYLSPATQSISIVITPQGGSAMAPINAALTPSGPGCSSSIASTNCSVEISLDPGSYTATFTTYDGALDGSGNPTGSVLSENQNVSFTVTAGQQNTIGLSLFGLPATVRLMPNADAVTVVGDHTSGYTLIGTADTTFDIIAEDADGDVIIGPGSPVYQVTSNGPQVVVDREPSVTEPNSVLLRAPGFSPQIATLSVSVTNLSDYGITCSACSDQISLSAGAAAIVNPMTLRSAVGLIGLDVPTSNVASVIGNAYYGIFPSITAGEIAVSNPPYDAAHTITSPLPSLPVGSFSTQFVLGGSTVYVFQTSYSGSGTFANTVTQMPPPYTSSSTIFSMNAPGPLFQYEAGSPDGDVAFAVQSPSSPACSIYDKPASAGSFTDVVDIPGTGPSSLAFGYDGSLVAGCNNSQSSTSTIAIYNSAASSTNSFSFSGTENGATTDGSGTLYYLSGQAASVVAPPYTAITATTSSGRYVGLTPLPNGVFSTLQGASTLNSIVVVSSSASVTPYVTANGFVTGVLP